MEISFTDVKDAGLVRLIEEVRKHIGDGGDDEGGPHCP